MNSGIAELLAGPYASRALMGILGVTLVFFAVISVVLLYHWKKYESTNIKIAFVAMIYLSGSMVLLGGAAYYLFLFIK